MQFTVFDTMAQVSTLWLRNGKKIAINNYSLDTSNYYDGKIFYTKLNGSGKSKFKEEVFSVVDKSGNETIFYTPNIELGEILTPEQMKQYVSGIGDSRISRVSPFVMIGGFASGFAGAFVPQPEIEVTSGSMPIQLGVLVPAIYIGVMGATPPNTDKLQQNYPVTATNEHYLMGYQEGVKKKRLKNSIIGAGVGFLSGILIYSAIN
jgi:hypothetical protein